MLEDNIGGILENFSVAIGQGGDVLCVDSYENLML